MAKVAVVAMVLAVAAMAMVADAGKVIEVKWDIPTSNHFYSAVQGKTYNVGDTLSKCRVCILAVCRLRSIL